MATACKLFSPATDQPELTLGLLGFPIFLFYKVAILLPGGDSCGGILPDMQYACVYEYTLYTHIFIHKVKLNL